MTTEQKAKAYDKAFERAKQWCNAPNVDKIPTFANRVIKEIFPELKESEDDRIRKALIDFFQDWHKTKPSRWSIPVSDVIAWLEKQGEQKVPVDDFKAKDWYVSKVDGKIRNIYYSVDKVEPKFKIGDWVIDKQGIVHQIANVIENVTYHTYGYDIVGGGYFNDNTEGVRLWTIQDAKGGDVLTTYTGRPFIFKGCLDERHPNSPVAYCGVNYDNCFFVSSGISWWTDENVYPATKEQHDTLMKAIADAGYVFDFEKKELKKIEQNPTNRVEPKFKVGDWITNGATKPAQISSIEDDMYYTHNGTIGGDIESMDKDYHLWTIADAKDGDMLSDGTTIFIFKDLLSDGSVISHCDYDTDSGKSDVFCPLSMNLMCSKITPATKEQCNLLFQKIKENGYEWDAEKKELKKIEQKPIQETKPFEVEHGKYYYCIKDCFCGGRKQASKGDVVQALRGLPIMSLKNASEYFLPVNFIKEIW